MSFPNHWTDYGSSPIEEGELVAFTGHRPDKLGGYRWSPIQELVCRAIRWKLAKLKPRGVISGMALGVDQWAAQIALELGIPFAAYIPFEGQECAWPEESQETYRGLLLRADRIQTCSGPGYSPRKMQWRNMSMVNDSDVLFSIWDGTDGGTANCVRYALNGFLGWNIWSGSYDGDGLAAALTNPTETSFYKGTVYKRYPVEFEGCVWVDVETAWHKLSKLASQQARDELMIRMIKAKLDQYPELAYSIGARGGTDWLRRCSHITGAKTLGMQAWEGIGVNSRFIRNLIGAYEAWSLSIGTYSHHPVRDLPRTRVIRYNPTP